VVVAVVGPLSRTLHLPYPVRRVVGVPLLILFSRPELGLVPLRPPLPLHNRARQCLGMRQLGPSGTAGRRWGRWGMGASS
jgi:hypothetical protein